MTSLNLNDHAIGTPSVISVPISYERRRPPSHCRRFIVSLLVIAAVAAFVAAPGPRRFAGRSWNHVVWKYSFYRCQNFSPNSQCATFDTSMRMSPGAQSACWQNEAPACWQDLIAAGNDPLLRGSDAHDFVFLGQLSNGNQSPVVALYLTYRQESPADFPILGMNGYCLGKNCNHAIECTWDDPKSVGFKIWARRLRIYSARSHTPDRVTIRYELDGYAGDLVGTYKADGKMHLAVKSGPGFGFPVKPVEPVVPVSPPFISDIGSYLGPTDDATGF